MTLTTDIGPAYAAQMKAVLYRMVPDARIVDLSHDVRAHAIAEAAFLLRHMASGFPAGSVHVAVIDPGVGGRRRPIAVRCRDGTLLVGPDNGVLVPLANHLGAPEAFALRRERFAECSRVGATFDGRDLFAPAAARLASGAAPESLGSRGDFAPFELPVPDRRATSVVGAILHVDRFGNLITNVPSSDDLGGATTLRLRTGRSRSERLVRARVYEELPRGRLGILPSSFGSWEFALREARAERRLRLRVGGRFRMDWRSPSAGPRGDRK